ncbi:hypothetical protein JTB14_005545 [Gonioctena quinquepunctata]|nr:hypothetical protein JTB14_005545 [Gonioctena quinquepunctata]
MGSITAEKQIGKYSQRDDTVLYGRIEDEKKKKSILLICCDEEAYELLENLCIPNSPEKHSFEELISLLDEHFIPVQGSFAERQIFYAASKSSEESVNYWAAHIKSLALKCDFKSELQMLLTHHFVIGFNEGKIKESLFEKKMDIALEKIIGIACSHEVRIDRRGLLPQEDLFYSRARNSSADMDINQSRSNSSKLATTEVRLQ